MGHLIYLQVREMEKIKGLFLGGQEKYPVTVCHLVKEVENRGVTVFVFNWKKVQVAKFAFRQEPGPEIFITRLVAVLWWEQFNTE